MIRLSVRTSTVDLGEEAELSESLVKEHFANFVVLVISMRYILVRRKQHVHHW